MLRGGAAMVTDLKTKVEKYESKAAHCKESAQQAVAGPQRAIYEVLAGYYSELAMDFRQVIEKRKASIAEPADPEVMPAMLKKEAAPDVTPWPEAAAPSNGNRRTTRPRWSHRASTSKTVPRRPEPGDRVTIHPPSQLFELRPRFFTNSGVWGRLPSAESVLWEVSARRRACRELSLSAAL